MPMIIAIVAAIAIAALLYTYAPGNNQGRRQ
jgi:hypothetical protein